MPSAACKNGGSYRNELVMAVRLLALGTHSLFVIKPLVDWRKALHLLPRLNGMLKAVATNWFPCLPFVMGTTQQIDALHQLFGKWEVKHQDGCLVSRQIDGQPFGYWRRHISHFP